MRKRTFRYRDVILVREKAVGPLPPTSGVSAVPDTDLIVLRFQDVTNSIFIVYHISRNLSSICI